MTTNTTDNTTTTTSTSTSTMTDDSLYKGPVKMIWKDGQRIQVPDYGPFDNPSFIAASKKTHEKYVYQKTLDDILSKEDKAR
jgi:hypothetical protein